MRTTLDLDKDVLDAARALASSRGMPVGAALSELARRGMASRMPLSGPRSFPVFDVPAGTPKFGPDEVTAVSAQEDREVAREFLEPVR